MIAFAFGLLHGFGFAGALAEIGLPEGDVPLALLTFNLGVELGQLFFVVAIVFASTLLNRIQLELPVWTLKLPAYTVGIVAAYWTYAAQLT